MGGQIITADGITGTEIHVDSDDVMYARPVMNKSIRGAILERNKQLRNDTNKPINDLSFGRVMLSFPEIDYWHIRKRWPDMFEGDALNRKRGLQKFLASPESEPYRVQP